MIATLSMSDGGNALNTDVYCTSLSPTWPTFTSKSIQCPFSSDMRPCSVCLQLVHVTAFLPIIRHSQLWTSGTRRTKVRSTSTRTSQRSSVSAMPQYPQVRSQPHPNHSCNVTSLLTDVIFSLQAHCASRHQRHQRPCPDCRSQIRSRHSACKARRGPD